MHNKPTFTEVGSLPFVEYAVDADLGFDIRKGIHQRVSTTYEQREKANNKDEGVLCHSTEASCHVVTAHVTVR